VAKRIPLIIYICSDLNCSNINLRLYNVVFGIHYSFFSESCNITKQPSNAESGGSSFRLTILSPSKINSMFSRPNALAPASTSGGLHEAIKQEPAAIGSSPENLAAAQPWDAAERSAARPQSTGQHVRVKQEFPEVPNLARDPPEAPLRALHGLPVKQETAVANLVRDPPEAPLHGLPVQPETEVANLERDPPEATLRTFHDLPFKLETEIDLDPSPEDEVGYASPEGLGYDADGAPCASGEAPDVVTNPGDPVKLEYAPDFNDSSVSSSGDLDVEADVEDVSGVGNNVAPESRPVHHYANDGRPVNATIKYQSLTSVVIF
jgi:hypothetical protein